MLRFVYLSYALNEKTPVYPGDAPVSTAAVRLIKRGDVCNTSTISISSHAGTHMDVPYHFFENGKRVDEYENGFVFDSPYVIECLKGPGEAIERDDIDTGSAKKKSDIIIIRTGFGKYRSKDEETYRHKNPYLLPDAAEYLVKIFPKARAIGIDTVSVSSKANSGTGREVHKILLGRGIIIIEDMRLTGRIKNMKKISVFPVFTCAPDGSPCVVVGVKDD